MRTRRRPSFETLEGRLLLSIAKPAASEDNTLLGGVVDLIGNALGVEKADDDNSGPGRGPGSGPGKKIDAAPVAEISVADRTLRSATAHTIEITYTDDKKVRASSIDVADITVTGPDEVVLTVTQVAKSSDKDENEITATYSVAAPGGRWDSADNGAYTVTFKPAQVLDNKSQPAATVSASFNVNVAAIDEAAPTGTYAVENITTAGGTTHKIIATYTDDLAMNLLSVGKNDLTIIGPSGERAVQSVSVTPNADATFVVATYTFDAPGDAWGPEDNGTYQITLDEGQVKDASGKLATAPAASFTVNVPNPTPVDKGFGGSTNGAVSTSFTAEAVVAQSDGKILVAGRTGNFATGASRAVLARFNTDGTLDSTFGTRGKVTTPAGPNDAYYAIALNAAGEIFVTGTRGGDVLLTKYTSAGKLDTTFDKDGYATVDFETSTDAAYAIGIAPTGAILIAAGAGGDFAMARFLPTGNLDPDFAQGGKQMFDLGADDDTPSAIAFQGDKAVIVGSSGPKVAVVRLRADGEADPTFSGDGLLVNGTLAARSGADFADHSTAATVQADGKLLLANRSDTGDFAIARLNAGGGIDNSFGTAGVKTIDFGGDDDADAIIVQDTGEILVIGTTNVAGVASTAIAALDIHGELIETFGAAGKLTLTPDAAPASRALHLGDLVLRAFGTKQPDGRVVVGTTDGGPVTQVSSSSSSLRRLVVPGVRTAAMGNLLSEFGVIDGKRVTYRTADLDGTTLIFSASRGTGTVYESGGRYNLVLNDSAGGASARIRAIGGEDGRVKLGDVVVNGALHRFYARAADLSGTLYASGSIDRVMIGDLTGTLVAAGTISSVSLNSMTGARVMSGTGLGANGKLGGSGADADSFGPGEIGTIRVSGAIEDSTISAGLDPVDGVFNNDDDRVISPEASTIRSILADSADDDSHFITGMLESLRLPKPVDVLSDDRVTLGA